MFLAPATRQSGIEFICWNNGPTTPDRICCGEGSFIAMQQKGEKGRAGRIASNGDRPSARMLRRIEFPDPMPMAIRMTLASFESEP